MNPAEIIIELRSIAKHYMMGSEGFYALNGIDLDIYLNDYIAIVGSSGSGKSTLMNLLGCLDYPTDGEYRLKGTNVATLDENSLAGIRNREIGFIFQNFQLLPTLTALENVMVPLELKKRKDAKEKAMELLDKVGLKDRATHYPTQLSGGEQQRVSIARAFANAPKILFADEPTGNLDTETGTMIENLIFDLNKEQGTTLVLVTHDLELAAKTRRIVHIKGGKIQEDTHA